LVFSIGKPFINAGLARMPDATVNLAAFSVASSLGWIIIAPSQTIHMLTMVHGREAAERPTVRKFILWFAACSTLLILAIAFSPAGPWVLTRLISVPSESMAATLLALRALAIFPLIICWQEYNSGLLMLGRSTRLVSLAKALNLATTITFVLLVAPRISGVIAAPLAQLVGYAMEGTVSHGGRWWLGHNLTERAVA
jgi:hypothetical protein